MSDIEGDGSNDEILRLRRFALATSLALFVFVAGGGELRDEVSASLITIIHFQRPNILLILLAVATAYGCIRYWYHAIHLFLTRGDIRAYLESPESILVFPYSEDVFATETNPGNSKGAWWKAQNALLARLPEGLPRSHCIVIGHISDKSEHLQKAVAAKAERYFPDPKPHNVSVKTLGDQVFWANISSKSAQTLWTCRSEEFDLWLPVIAGALSIGLFEIYETWPWVERLLSKLN
jgi:hypothetical protein